MRTLTRARAPDRPDRGAVLVWVALMMVALLGAGALVVDIGALYVEKRQLQNGADAAALAVAQDCAGGDCGDEYGMAGTYADLNAKDGASAVDTVCGQAPGLEACPDPPPARAADALGWVRVRTSTETESGGDQVSFLLAPIITMFTGQTVRAAAVAAWGPVGGGLTLPFTFSECEFQRMIPDGGTFPVGTVTIYSKAQGNQEPLVPDCEPRSAPGGTVEGNFGWLDVTGPGCAVELEVGDTVIGPADPGNNNLLTKAPCSPSMVRGQEVLVPLFNRAEGVGNNARYTIAGFAAFVVTGYQLSGDTWPSGFSCPQVPGGTGGTGNLRCFQGYFTRTVAHGEIGGYYDFGASAVVMAG